MEINDIKEILFDNLSSTTETGNLCFDLFGWNFRISKSDHQYEIWATNGYDACDYLVTEKRIVYEHILDDFIEWLKDMPSF